MRGDISRAAAALQGSQPQEHLQQPVARGCSAPAHRHVLPAGQCRQAPFSPPIPPSPPPSLPPLPALTFPPVAAHAAGDDSASLASSSASNSSPSPSHKKRNSLARVGAVAAARLPSSAGGLGLGQLESRRPSVKSHHNSQQEELSAKNVADHERASAVRTLGGDNGVTEFFDVADAINSCTVVTPQQRAALRQRIKKSQAAVKP